MMESDELTASSIHLVRSCRVRWSEGPPLAFSPNLLAPSGHVRFPRTTFVYNVRVRKKQEDVRCVLRK